MIQLLQLQIFFVEIISEDFRDDFRSSDFSSDNVVVRFVPRNKRNDLLAKARKLRLNATALWLEGSISTFVSEHLTQQNKKLLAAARQKKKALNWKFIWTSGGKIFARNMIAHPWCALPLLMTWPKFVTVND